MSLVCLVQSPCFFIFALYCICASEQINDDDDDEVGMQNSTYGARAGVTFARLTSILVVREAELAKLFTEYSRTRQHCATEYAQQISNQCICAGYL